MRVLSTVKKPLAISLAALSGMPLFPVLASAAESLALEEVVVTARRKVEDLQSTPVAVRAFSADDIELRSVKSIEDVGQLIPNVSIAPDSQAGSAAANIYIRGVGQQDYRIFTDPAVTLYVDGVLIPRAVGGLLSILDVERVEVLKGPQGTLFGKNTVAGAIKIDSKRPADELSGSLQLTLGEDQRFDAGASLNLPLSEQLLSKVAISHRSSDGWGKSAPLQNELGQVSAESDRADEEMSAGLLQLHWLGDSLDALWSFDITRSRSNGSARHPLAPSPSMSPPNLAGFYNLLVQMAGLSLPLADATGISDDVYTTSSNFAEKADLDVWGTGLTLTWDLGDYSLKSVTSYRELENALAIDFDGLQARLFDQSEDNEQEQWGQEIQLSGLSLDGQLDWVAGLFYFAEDGRRSVTSQRLGALLDLGLAGQVPVLSNDFRRNIVTKLDSKAYAVFGQGTYRLNEMLSLTAGLRWSREEKTLSGVQVYAVGFDTERQVASGEASDSWESLTPRLSLELQLHDDLMLYASAAQGFKSGGFNGRLNASLPNGGILPYDAEEVLTYELGLRSEWLDSRLRLNATLFHSDYSDIQTETTDVINGDVVNTVGNAAEARMQGLELDLIAQLTQSVQLDASLGYIDAEYVEIGDTAVDIDEQTVFPRTPRWSATLGLEYGTSLASGNELRARLDISYQGDSYSAINPADEPAADLELDAYTLANLRIDYVIPEQWTFSLFAKNLFDEEYRVNAGYQGGGIGAGYEIFGAPRQAGISVKKHF